MPPNDAPQDLDAVRLAKAIRYTESRDREDAKGASGEFGLYQFMPATWASTTKKYNLDPNDRSRANQNKAAYLQIKELKDKGYKANQIAAFWNSGKTEGWENMRGTNQYGAKYDVPEYVKKVGSVYEGLKVNDVPKQVTTASTAQNVLPPKKDLLQKTGDVVNAIFPGKQVGKAIGTLGALAYEKAKGLMGGVDRSEHVSIKGAPTPLQVAGDVAQGALMVGAGVPGATPVSAFGKTVPALKTAGSVIGRIGQGVGVGGAYGLTGGLARGETDAKELAKDTAIGGVVGGGLTAGGEAVGAIARNLPRWFVQSHIPKIDAKTAQYAVDTKKLGNPVKMYAQSEAELKKVGKELSNVIKNPKGSFVQPNGNEILTKVADSFENAGLGIDDVAAQLKKMAPLHTKLVDKLVTGQNMTIDELWTLNKAIGPKIFKGTPFDDPSVRAGKEVANATWHALERVIKDSVPESVPLFERYAQERALNIALDHLATKQANRPFLRMSLGDLLFFLGGHTAGGPLGGVAGIALQRTINSPTTNLGIAGLINKLPQGGGSVYSPVKGAITRGLSGL